MLVLSRQRDEEIVIVVPEGAKAGDRIVFTVVDIRGDKVRMGIEGPREYPIHRAEVLAAIERESRP